MLSITIDEEGNFSMINDLDIIKAVKNDSKVIWQWRNDPQTRLMYFQSSEISWEDHSEWYSKILKDENRIIYMGIEKYNQIGVLRFDRDPKTYHKFKVSINISPNYRKMGYGKRRC